MTGDSIYLKVAGAYVPLFPYPFCGICFTRLHAGHKGWDVCVECAFKELNDIRTKYEFIECSFKEYTCSCYAFG